MRSVQRRKKIAARLDPEGFARVMLALIQGFVLQLAWEPEVDIARYRDTMLSALDGLVRG